MNILTSSLFDQPGGMLIMSRLVLSKKTSYSSRTSVIKCDSCEQGLDKMNSRPVFSSKIVCVKIKKSWSRAIRSELLASSTPILPFLPLRA